MTSHEVSVTAAKSILWHSWALWMSMKLNLQRNLKQLYLAGKPLGTVRNGIIRDHQGWLGKPLGTIRETIKNHQRNHQEPLEKPSGIIWWNPMILEHLKLCYLALPPPDGPQWFLKWYLTIKLYWFIKKVKTTLGSLFLLFSWIPCLCVFVFVSLLSVLKEISCNQSRHTFLND